MTVTSSTTRWAYRTRCPLHGAHVTTAVRPSSYSHAEPAAGTEEEASRLRSIFLSGMTSGIATFLRSSDVPAVLGMAAARSFVARISDDPAVRHDLTEDLVRLWRTGQSVGLTVRTAYTAPTSPDQTGPDQ